MGWVKTPTRKTSDIFKEIVKEGWSGNIKDSSTPFEYWSDRIKDNYDVTLLQCNMLCKMIKQHYKIKKFYAND